MSLLRRRMMAKKEENRPGYVTYGLTLLLDGIQNTRSGHSSTTTSWEDLSGYNRDFEMVGELSNDGSGYLFNNNRNNYFVRANDNLLSSRTFEIVFEFYDSSDTQCVISSNSYGDRNIQIYGNARFSFTASVATPRVTDATPFRLTKKTLTIVKTSADDYGRNCETYYDAIKQVNGSSEYSVTRYTYDILLGATNNPASQDVYRPLNGKIYCVRAYDRELTQREIEQNQLIDRTRFGG